MSSSVEQIHHWLERYLSGEISLEAFHNWFIPSSWEIEKSGDQEAAKLAHRIQLRLAEFSGGAWNERELRTKLWPIYGLQAVTIVSGNPAITSSSDSVTEMAETQIQFFDIERVGEYA